MKFDKIKKIGVCVTAFAASAIAFAACQAPLEPKAVLPVKIAQGEIDPAEWGKAYPMHYDLWKKTAEPTPAGKSKYKKGFDADGITYDKLSEFPYMALLFKGWGFGIEYNEPRGHAYMMKDQWDIDPSRVKAGGGCLTCKTPYATKLQKELGADYYKLTYKEAVAKIPEKYRELGVACIDCHNPEDMSLHISRGFTLSKALQAMGVDEKNLSRQDMRSLVCAQCHVTYYMPKDKDMKTTDVVFPWQGSKMGNISIENIIKVLKSDPANLEWKQAVTGLKMPYIRHPEYELYSMGSVHWNAGVACADCHMPYTTVGSAKMSDHRVTSPLKSDMKACAQCHAESPEWLKQQVFNIQDRMVSQMIRSGYATANVAKLFERVHKLQESGKNIDQGLYDKAKDLYMEAFLRVIYCGAENSVGFHNPPEALRIAADANAFAERAAALLRQGLTQIGETVPVVIDLELQKYVEGRGDKKLPYNPAQEIKDPFGVQAQFM